jgi:hypothetical protein
MTSFKEKVRAWLCQHLGCTTIVVTAPAPVVVAVAPTPQAPEIPPTPPIA